MAYHNIIWLDVSMDYALHMTVINSIEKFLHVACGSLFSELVTLHICDFFKECLAVDVFHHKVEVLSVVVCFEVFYNIWVVDSCQDIYFVNDLANFSF